MISREEYIQLSIVYNLFWLRIMKEHAIFIMGSLLPPQKQLVNQAERFKQQFTQLLTSTIRAAAGIIPQDVLQSGQYYTNYTEEAERLTEVFTGLDVNKNVTISEYNIEPFFTSDVYTIRKEDEVTTLNNNIMTTLRDYIKFKSDLFNSQASCRIASFLYTSIIRHVLHEAQKYMDILSALQRRDEINMTDYKKFWTEGMADHSKAMRGLFDPIETTYFNQANQFANTFDNFLVNMPGDAVLLNQTEAISNFKSDTTRGIIECKVKSLMLPLFADHLLREANHFKYILK